MIYKGIIGPGYDPDLERTESGYETASNATNVREINPVDQKYVPRVFTLTNVPAATPDDTSIIDMDGFRSCSVQVVQTSGTATFTWTMESSVEGRESTSTWDDSTQYGFTSATDANAASYAATGILYSVQGFTPVAHRVKIATAGADDGDFKIYVKKFY